MTELRNSRPFDIAQQDIDDLYEEAKNWLVGGEIENAAEAEEITKLLDLMREAHGRADQARKTENEPFDTGKAEVQGRYNPLLARADRVTKACRELLTTWRGRVAAEQQREAEALAAEAAKKRAEAEHVAEVAGGDLGAKEIAEATAEIADRFERNAKKAVKNAGKGLRMRTVYDFIYSDIKLTIAHYYRTRPDELREMIDVLVKTDIRTGSRELPGVTITEKKEAY